MRTQNASFIAFAAAFAVCMLLLGSIAASAVPRDEERLQNARNKICVPAQAGGVKDSDASFLRSLSVSTAASYCESSCCWALCPQWGGGAYCSDNYCEAWCPDGSYSITFCWET
jgi:hypothetical protein